MKLSRIGLLGAVIAAGCSSQKATPGEALTSDTAALSYWHDVKPIVEEKCVKCHSEGSFAPFALQTWKDLASRPSLIRAAVSSREMPPWLADKGCADYEGDMSLSDAQIDTIVKWIDQGAVEGSQGDYLPPPPPPPVGLTRTDLSLKLDAPYEPRVSPDDYRCFVMDWPATTKKYVTGFLGRPGDPTIVHHILAFTIAPSLAKDYVDLDAKEPGPGYTCFGGPGGPGIPSTLGIWAPGSSGSMLPPGVGLPVEPGSKVVLQVHYNTLAGKKTSDQTAMEFMTEDRVEKDGYFLGFTNPEWIAQSKMPVPANDPDVVHRYAASPGLFLQLAGGALDPAAPFTIYDSLFHMHTRGTHGSFAIEREDGAHECLVNIRKWNFHWQQEYRLSQPKRVMPGDKFSLECHWDNTAGNQPFVDGRAMRPKDLNWGEGTTDEMCIAGFLVTQ